MGGYTDTFPIDTLPCCVMRLQEISDIGPVARVLKRKIWNDMTDYLDYPPARSIYFTPNNRKFILGILSPLQLS